MTLHLPMTSARARAARSTAVLLAVLAAVLSGASAARADFQFDRFDAGFVTASGNPATQAGSHSDLVVGFGFNQITDPDNAINIPGEQLKEFQVDLPAGFYGNPQAAPTCSTGELIAGQGYCNPDAQVGVADVQIGPDPNVPFLGTYHAPVYNMPAADGKTASLTFAVLGIALQIDIGVRTDGDYGLRATLRNANSADPIYATKLQLWGVPADPAHDADRQIFPFAPPRSAGVPRRPFLTMPARCAPVTITGRASSWQHPTHWAEASSTTPTLTGCDSLTFSPRIAARPTNPSPDKPSGMDVDLTVPQDESYSGVATPQLKTAVVTLPEGVAISPASAQGLEACSDDQLGLGTKGEPTCPEASKIGSVSIDTPVLADPLKGDIILGTPKPGQLFRLFLVARGSGILLKLPGVAQPDPSTGQLTTTFEDTPQLPFTKLHLHFKSGARAPLALPESCGTKTTTATLTPWAGATATPTDSFALTGCAGGFAPTFEAGTVNPEAGAFSPFTMTIRRNDGDQELSGISVNLPPGLLGVLDGIPVCAEAQAAAGTCDDATKIGTTTVESGSGDQPLPLAGKVFLASPYKGAPYSLSIVVRAVAGPFDLGTVVVRAPLNIDAAAGKVAVPADVLPTILQGVPLRLKTINVTLDRPGFMRNPTNCAPSEITAALRSTAGAVANVSSRFQVGDCAALGFAPKMAMRLTNRSQTTDGRHPGLDVLVTQGAGQANLKRVVAALPLSLALDPENSQSDALCSFGDGLKDRCPVSSEIGTAEAVSPLLNRHLYGKVYFVKGLRLNKQGQLIRTLPTLLIALRGEINLDLRATSKVDSEGRLVTTFANIPDAALSGFRLQLRGGKHGILVVTGHRNLCRAKQVSDVQTDGQNGKTRDFSVAMKAPCVSAKMRARASAKKRS